LPDKSGNYKNFVEAVLLEVKLGDVLQLKKPHPCGSYDWEVVRLGANIGIQCLKCHRRVLLEQGVLEQRLKRIQNAKGKKQGRLVPLRGAKATKQSQNN
jgi:hypothetical protein